MYQGESFCFRQSDEEGEVRQGQARVRKTHKLQEVVANAIC